MKSTNPVLSRIGAAGHQPRYQTAGYGSPGHGAPSYGAPVGAPYESKVIGRGAADVMTIDDVVVKTVSLFGVTILAAAATFGFIPDSLLVEALIGGAVLGLIIGLVISFAQLTNPALMFTYAVVEGVFLGAVSKLYETQYHGIVLQAVIATLGTFLVMTALYRARIIRVTPRFMKVVIGLAAGLMVVLLLNLLVTIFTDSATVLRDGGPIAIGFSLVCITVAALMVVVNFRQIEDGVAAGLPRRYGWLGAFGLLVEVVWLYLEFLRLISYFMDE